MALQKNISFKGIPLSYWVISMLSWSKSSNKTTVTIIGYASHESRIADVNNGLTESTKTFSYVGRLTLQDAYIRVAQETTFIGSANV